MATIAVLYATREGQTRKVAEHVAGVLRDQRSLQVEVHNAAKLPRDFQLARASAVLLAASLHAGTHEREMVSFVKRNREALARLPTALISVSLSEATVEGAAYPPEKREQARHDVAMAIERFCKSTQFRPTHIQPVAGALMFSKYSPLIRFVMRRIAKAAGGSTDTRRDHEFTDWPTLTQFATRFADEVLTSAHEAVAVQAQQARA
jgi:menaquinone-dependent protoporphyrinogen oxidase